MKKTASLLTAFLLALNFLLSPALFAQDEYEYVEGSYDAPFDPYDSSAPVYGAQTGVSIYKVGLGLIAVGAAAGIIIASSSGSSSSGHN